MPLSRMWEENHSVVSRRKPREGLPKTGRSSHPVRLVTREERQEENDSTIEPPIEHRDVTTIMGILGDMYEELRKIRMLLEEDDGQEEEPAEDDS
jgi:hypothetical protein